MKISLYTTLSLKSIMARGYQIDDVRKKLGKILHNSKTGLSGVEISEQIGINRITMTKYLNIFAAEGSISQKNIGNVTLWFVKQELEPYDFPDDYFKITPKFFDYVIDSDENQAYSLIKNCIRSGAKVDKLIIEVILPAIENIQKLYAGGKIGNSEKNLSSNIILKSLEILYHHTTELNPSKNSIVISADPENELLSNAASTFLHNIGWQVFYLGNMSSAINILFDLDLQKLLRKVWKQKSGIMIIMVFSNTEEGLNFFADAVNSLKEKLGKNLRLVLCGRIGKKTKIESDFISERLDDVLQWSETIFESSEK